MREMHWEAWGALFHAHRPGFLVKCTQRALRAKQSKKELPLKGQCRREIPNRIEEGQWTNRCCIVAGLRRLTI